MLTTPHTDSHHPTPPPAPLTTPDGQEITIRPIESTDVRALHWLSRHRSFAGGPTPDLAVAVPPHNAAHLAYVAEVDHRVVGFAIGWEQSGDVAHLSRPHVHDQFPFDDIAPRLARAAFDAFRDHGCLKVVLHTPALPERAIPILERSGLIFNRLRNHPGDPCLEFYLNLYDIPANSKPS
jgi:GNAT superfamily N-acetyltransferase